MRTIGYYALTVDDAGCLADKTGNCFENLGTKEKCDFARACLDAVEGRQTINPYDEFIKKDPKGLLLAIANNL